MDTKSPKEPIKILSDNDWMVWGMNFLKFSKQTKGDDCWVFRGLLIVLMLNEKIQGKSNKIHLIKDTQKIQGNPGNIMEASQEKRGFESGCDTSVLCRMFSVSSQMERRYRLA